eukprot:5913621-Pleurochrysis_carterae.AAC.1
MEVQGLEQFVRRCAGGYLFNTIGTRLSGGATVLLMNNSAAVEQADHTGASKKTEHYKRWEYCYLR